ncbi:MAG TPA: PKD domain-containing protein, partial [Bacteroidia bacterium]|nr:PKD domain-containing protein [Bacteroidia bacterium]
MSILKKIFFLAAVFCTVISFSQNKKTNYPLPTPQNLPPETNFSWLNACLGDSVCFINQTIRGNTYTWTVTDTNTHHPTTLFTSTNDTGFCYFFAKGSYMVSITAYNNHYATTTKRINIDTVTEADFSFIHCANNFVNVSTCASTFYWDFGDGTSSTLPLPNHRYADTGHYNVTLIAYKGGISDTMKKQIFVDVESFTNATFTHTVSHDTVFVHANYTGTGVNYYWTWGDQTYSSGQDTFHVYKDSTAIYTAELIVINSCGPTQHIDSISIVKQVPPQPDFVYSNTCFGDTTCFINQTPGANTYTWTVKVSNPFPQVIYTSNASPGFCFRFPAIGNYTVTLRANNNFYIVS